MKKTIFLVIAVLVLSFSFSQAQDPCAACLSPKVCSVANIGDMLPGCPDAKAIICYECPPSQPYMYVEVLEMQGVCPGYEDAVWDILDEWVLENQAELCGSIPCDQGSKTVEITNFSCADIYWDGTSLTYKRSSSCDLRCTRVFDWCWCNCTPDCIGNSPRTPCTPFTNYVENDPYTTGDGECVKEPYGPNTNYIYGATPWVLYCVQIQDDCN